MYQSIRWTARISSIVVVGFFLLFLIGEGVSVQSLMLREIMMFAAWAIAFAGMALGWKRELSGGTLTIAGYFLFVIIEGRFPLGVWYNPFFAAWAVNGLLFVLAGWLRSKKEPEAKTVAS